MSQSSLDALSKIYALSVDSGSRRLPVVERYLGISHPCEVSVDDRRNEHLFYQELAEQHRQVLDDAFRDLLSAMSIVTYDQADAILDGMDFLQSVVASTLWKHHFPLSESMETFARNFDRLDVPSERLRFYQLALKTSDTVNAFARLPWHDAELLEIRVGYDSSQHRVTVLDVAFQGTSAASGRNHVTFDDVRGISMDVDLLAKELCGNQIASGHCTMAERSTESFVQVLQQRFDLYRGETMDGLFVFTIELIHPAGTILVLARSFALTELNLQRQ